MKPLLQMIYNNLAGAYPSHFRIILNFDYVASTRYKSLSSGFQSVTGAHAAPRTGNLLSVHDGSWNVCDLHFDHLVPGRDRKKKAP